MYFLQRLLSSAKRPYLVGANTPDHISVEIKNKGVLSMVLPPHYSTVDPILPPPIIDLYDESKYRKCLDSIHENRRSKLKIYNFMRHYVNGGDAFFVSAEDPYISIEVDVSILDFSEIVKKESAFNPETFRKMMEFRAYFGYGPGSWYRHSENNFWPKRYEAVTYGEQTWHMYEAWRQPMTLQQTEDESAGAKFHCEYFMPLDDQRLLVVDLANMGTPPYKEVRKHLLRFSESLIRTFQFTPTAAQKTIVANKRQKYGTAPVRGYDGLVKWQPHVLKGYRDDGPRYYKIEKTGDLPPTFE